MAEKREKDKLKGSKEQFLLPFDNLIDPAIIIDDDGTVCEITDAVEEKSGFKREEIVGKKFFDLNIMTKEDKRVLKENFLKRMPREEINPYEFEVLTKDGGRVPVEAYGTLIRYKGRLAGLVILRDITERKAAEAVLQDSRDQYRELLRFNKQILEHSPVGILKLDEKLRITYENPAMKKILGVPPDKESKVIGTDIREVPSVKATGKTGMFDDLLKGKKISGILPFKSIYGKESLMSVTCSPIFDGVKFKGAVLIATDITERKRADEVLRESEEKFRLAFENAKDAIFWADPKTGLITNCNKAAETLLEKKQEEIVGQHHKTLHPPQKAEYYANMFKRHVEQKRVIDDEAEVITKSGKIKPVHITASVMLVGGKPIIQGVFRDITDRKRVEKALQESEEKFRRAFTETHDDMWIVKVKDGNKFIYEEVNPSYCNYTGLDKGDIVGKHLHELFERETADKILEDYRWVVRERKPLKKEQHLKFLTGWKWHLTTLTPLLDANGNVDKIIGSGKDITLQKMFEDRIKMERETYRSIARAANQSRSVEEFSELALKGIRKVIKCDMANILIYQEPENTLFTAAQVGYPEELYQRIIKQQKLREESQGVVTQVVLKRRSIYIDDMKTSELTSYPLDLIKKYNLSTMYTVPLLSRDKLQGVLQVITTNGRKLSEEDRELLDTVSEELAGGIAKAKIEEQLITIKEAFGWLTQG